MQDFQSRATSRTNILIEAFKTPYVLSSQLNTFIETQIAVLFSRMDKQLDSLKCRFLAAELRSLISKYHSELREGELAFVLEQGYYEEYGKNYGITPVTLKNWLDEYSKSAVYLAAKKATAPLAIAAASTLTQDEKDQMCLDTARKCFEAFRDKECDKIRIKQLWAVAYNILLKYNFFSVDTKCKWDFFNIAKQNIKTEAERAAKQKKAVFKRFVVDAVDETEKVKIEAKKLIVQSYFNGLIERGEDLAIL